MKKISRNAVEGVAMLALALVFFWFPHYMQGPREANTKILVATAALRGGPFENSVVFVAQHNGYGALGFVLNKPPARSSDPMEGGPATPDKYFTLHTLDFSDEDTKQIEGISDLGINQGQEYSRTVASSARKPREYVVFHGSAQWGMGQLTREIEKGMWKVVPFDRALVFHTDPAKIYGIASGK
jgi:putative transcriptional regulator